MTSDPREFACAFSRVFFWRCCQHVMIRAVQKYNLDGYCMVVIAAPRKWRESTNTRIRHSKAWTLACRGAGVTEDGYYILPLPQNLWVGIEVMTQGFAGQGSGDPRSPFRVHGISV